MAQMHTPGPWEYRHAGKELIAVAREGYMAHAQVFNRAAGGSLKAEIGEEEIANARLIALAHYFARSKPGDANLEMLNRLYMEMNPRDKLRCQAALHVVRAARRGERVAS